MDFNTRRGMKRSTIYKIEDQASSSKLPQTANTNIAVGVQMHVAGNAKVSIGEINMIQQQVFQQQLPPLELPNDDFQVTDPVDTFRGREQELRELERAFTDQEDMRPFNLVAVCGYGGIGKTQFARMYIKKNRLKFQYVVWIFAESQTTMKDSFNLLQNKLTDIEYRCYNHQDVYEHLNSNLVVFVFDNSEDMRSIQSYLPAKHNKSLFLITSKSKNWHVFKTIELSNVNMQDAEDIMKAVLIDTHKIVISDTQLKELVKKFEPIPLVLQIRAAYICQKVRILKKRGNRYNIEDIINRSDIKYDFVTETFHNFFLDLYDKSIFEAVFPTLEKIWNGDDDASKNAAKMLGMSAYLYADGIEENILKNILQIENEDIFNDSLDILEQFSLFQIDGLIRVHRTIQQCLQYYQKVIKESDDCYLLALRTLFYNNFFFGFHYETIFKYIEKDFELFYKFYEENKHKCLQLHSVIVESAPYIILTQLLNKLKIIPKDFLCEILASNRENIRQILSNLSVDYNAKDEQGLSLFHYVCIPNDIDNYFHSSISAIKTLIEIGADINSQNSNGCTVLHTLCELGKNNSGKDQDIYVACTFLIKEGANPDITNNTGQTPADLAQEFKLTLTYKLLISVLPGGLNLLHIATEAKQFKLLNFLVKRRELDINQRDNSGCTIFHVLAALALEEGEEDNPLYGTACTLWRNFADISTREDVNIVNNSGETPEDVARRCGRKQLAGFLNAHAQPGRNIYHTTRLPSLEYFPLVSGHGDEQNTLLHSLCGLEMHNDIELELELVKFTAYLIVKCDANVHIRTEDNDTAADVARRHGHHVLADFLDRMASDTAAPAASVELVYVALRHNKFALIEYAWWRYLNYLTRRFLYATLNSLGCRVLRILCESDNLAVTDGALISLIDYLDLKHMAKYNKMAYLRIVEIARQHGRQELAAWLIIIVNKELNI